MNIESKNSASKVDRGAWHHNCHKSEIEELSTSSESYLSEISSSTQLPSSYVLYDYMELSLNNNECSVQKKINSHEDVRLTQRSILEQEVASFTSSTSADELSNLHSSWEEEKNECQEKEMEYKQEKEKKNTLEECYQAEKLDGQIKRNSNCQSSYKSKQNDDVCELVHVLTEQEHQSKGAEVDSINAISDQKLMYSHRTNEPVVLDDNHHRQKRGPTNERNNKNMLPFCLEQEEEKAKKNDSKLSTCKKLMNSTIVSNAHHSSLIEEQLTAQSAFTGHNPFRTQTFVEFCANPEYETPNGFHLYSDAVKDVVYHGYAIAPATEGEYLTQRLLQYALTSNLESNVSIGSTKNDAIEESGRQLARISVLRDQLYTLHRGTWLYKWARSNKVHKRFVWLDLQIGCMMWSRSPQSWFVNSQFRISEIVDIVPDVINHSLTSKVFYRFMICTNTRRLYFATELREKFELWFFILRQLTEMNMLEGIPGISSRPSSKVYGNQGAISRWALRYSPLQALMAS